MGLNKGKSQKKNLKFFFKKKIERTKEKKLIEKEFNFEFELNFISKILMIFKIFH